MSEWESPRHNQSCIIMRNAHLFCQINVILLLLLLLLFTCTSIPITLLPTYSSSLLNTRPYHSNLLPCTFLGISPTFVVTLILSFLIMSSLVTPLIHLNILISATSNFFSCAFFTAHLSRHRTSLLVLQLSCRSILSLDSQTYSSVTQNPRYPLPVLSS